MGGVSVLIYTSGLRLFSSSVTTSVIEKLARGTAVRTDIEQNKQIMKERFFIFKSKQRTEEKKWIIFSGSRINKFLNLLET